MARKAVPVAERLKQRTRHMPNGCIEWIGATNTVGYGRIKLPGPIYRQAHRVAYELAKGPIPEGMNILHECDNRRCCNPDHLRTGTQAENVQDAMHKGRMPQLTSEWLRARGRGY